MLVDGLAQPVDSWVPADHLVLGVDHNHLKELVDRVLPHPVRVEDPQATTVSTCTLLQEREGIYSEQPPI